MPKVVEHSFNWCRLCRTCLTCKRFPRNVFQTGSCKCVQRHITHRAKDVKKNWTTDFRFRHLKRGEVLGLIHLSQQIEGFSHPIEPELTRANLCGTCQQRLRRAVDATKEPIKDSSSSTALSADFRKHRSIRETIRKHNMANIAFSPPALEDRACSYSPDNIWPFDSQGFTNGEASKRCSSHEVLIDHAETSSAPPVVETQRRLSSPPVLQQQNDEAARYANERIVYPGNKRCCSSETATFALNESATRKCRQVNRA
ncbi:hypothetical protein J3B02_000909 [Coemansia erecta]|nr:hypothetical protein J3B02_000909 [Coemansia erecta]KAJ2887081.1 hypothetical protein FB639_001442 [Coemansia asiatica]